MSNHIHVNKEKLHLHHHTLGLNCLCDQMMRKGRRGCEFVVEELKELMKLFGL